MGCEIFCTACLGEDGATNIWKSIDALLCRNTKSLSQKQKAAAVWEKNADALGFKDAKLLHESPSFQKVGSFIRK